MSKMTDFLTKFHCFQQILAEKFVTRLLAESSSFLTPFSRFRSQPPGNTSGQHDIVRLPCHDANWREHAECKSRNTDAFLTHFDLAGVKVFFKLGAPCS